MADAIADRLRELGWSYPDINRNTNLSSGTVRSLVKRHRDSVPTIRTMRDMADAFGLDPNEWDEWQLAQARQLLDERDPPNGVGRDEALTNLSRFRAGLRAEPVRRSATRAAQPPSSPGPKR